MKINFLQPSIFLVASAILLQSGPLLSDPLTPANQAGYRVDLNPVTGEITDKPSSPQSLSSIPSQIRPPPEFILNKDGSTTVIFRGGFLINDTFSIGANLDTLVSDEQQMSRVINTASEVMGGVPYPKTLDVVNDLPTPSQFTDRSDMQARAKELLALVEEDGKINVIVGLRMPLALTARMSSRQSTSYIARISQLQTQLLGQLAVSSVEQVKRFKHTPYMALRVDPPTLAALFSSEYVTTIELDKLDTPSLSESVPIINADDVWAAGYTGNGVVVAVLDTGVDSTHGFLSGKVVSESCYSHSSTGEGIWSLCPDGSTEQTGIGAASVLVGECDYSDVDCDHGTHVSGIAAGLGSSFSGVAKQANLIEVQVFTEFYLRSDICGSDAPCVLTYSSDQISGLERIYELRSSYSIAAVNMSLGGGEYANQATCDSQESARKTAIDNLRAAGIATIISSGNEGFTGSMGAPGCISSAISVGATWDSAGDNNCDGNNGGTSSVDDVTCYSNSAPFLDVLAPGSMITSSIPGGNYASWGGTSMAAPHVAGCAALLKQKVPNATVSQIESALKNTGKSVTDWRNSIITPRIDCKAALDSFGGAGGAPNLGVSSFNATPASLEPGATLTMNVTTQNFGDVSSVATTVRYLRSSNATISSGDTQVCTDTVSALSAGSSESANCAVNAPSTVGDYFFGACVDSVSGETNSTNNCSTGTMITVAESGGGNPATININQLSGFDDTTPVTPVGGNNGTTVGEQRVNVFKAAADWWSQQLTSPVIIQVDANFKHLDCNSTSGILGSAGPQAAFMDFTNAPKSNVWYVEALANSLAGSDLSPATSDIVANFNSSLGTTGCLDTASWYYGLDGNISGGQIDLYNVVRHEMGHGLGFLTLVSQAGVLFNGISDTYLENMEDHALGTTYPSMSDAQRASANISDGNLHWVGGNAVALVGQLTAGASGGHPQLYAPNPYEPGSSLSHWDSDFSPDELMEPKYTNANPETAFTLAAFKDMGWKLNTGGGTGDCQVGPMILGPVTYTGNETKQSETSIATSGAVIISNGANVTFEAGQSIQLNPGFQARIGSEYHAIITAVSCP